MLKRFQTSFSFWLLRNGFKAMGKVGIAREVPMKAPAATNFRTSFAGAYFLANTSLSIFLDNTFARLSICIANGSLNLPEGIVIFFFRGDRVDFLVEFVLIILLTKNVGRGVLSRDFLQRFWLVLTEKKTI